MADRNDVYAQAILDIVKAEGHVEEIAIGDHRRDVGC